MYIKDDTKFVNLTDSASKSEVIGFYMDTDFHGHIVTSKFGTGYESFRKARAHLRNRRWGVGGCVESADNTVYIINKDNPVLMMAFAELVRSVEDEQRTDF